VRLSGVVRRRRVRPAPSLPAAKHNRAGGLTMANTSPQQCDKCHKTRDADHVYRCTKCGKTICAWCRGGPGVHTCPCGGVLNFKSVASGG
jgi:hypothetical protein